MSARLDFYYDYISPNAYLAWCDIRDIEQRLGCELSLRPILFAALLQAHNQVGPAEVVPKRNWMVRNCLRKARALNVPLQAPHSHPFNPLLPLRATLAAPATERHRLTDVLFAAAWGESRDVSEPESLLGILDQHGFDGRGLLAAANSQPVKAQLRSGTETALQNGVFGVPTFVVDGELFFGFDDLPWLERYLRNEDALDEQQYQKWSEIQPSAWRRTR